MRSKKKHTKDIDFYFTLLDLLEKGITPSKISKRLSISKQALNYYIKRLKENSYIEKVGYGVWKVNSKEVKKSTIYGRKIRGHGFRVKVTPKTLDKEKILKNLTDYKIIGSFKNVISFKFRNHTIWICRESIDIIFKKGYSIFSNSARDSHNKAILKTLDLIKGLENRLRQDFSYFKGNYKVRVKKHHYSLVKNELAKELLNRGINYVEIRDSDNLLWALVDNSFNLEEFEAVNSKTAIKDTDKVLSPTFNALRENPNLLNDLAENITLNTKMLKQMQEEIVLLTKLNRR